jgi:alpha-galactosidase
MERLRTIRPDILIEFRQPYTGPAMRSYANLFRAVDCPNSIGDNRVRTLDVRLLAGTSAVHSDPITWHDDEPAESAAMQIVHALFSVPQISRRISELTEPHRRMLRNQIAFCLEHRDVLQRGELRPLYPHMLYPLVIARMDAKMLVAFYAPMPAAPGPGIPGELVLVNGTYSDEVVLDLADALPPMEASIRDCSGELVSRDTISLAAGLNRIAVPPAGSAVLSVV